MFFFKTGSDSKNGSLVLFKRGQGLASPKPQGGPHQVWKLSKLGSACWVMWLVQFVMLLTVSTFVMPGKELWLLIYKTKHSQDWSTVISSHSLCKCLRWEHCEKICTAKNLLIKEQLRVCRCSCPMTLHPKSAVLHHLSVGTTGKLTTNNKQQMYEPIIYHFANLSAQKRCRFQVYSWSCM